MKYKVKAGDTLARIARLSGMTLPQLLEANPQLELSPDNLQVGTVLNIPDEFSTAVTQPLPKLSAFGNQTHSGAVGTALVAELGSLSAKYETSGRGPGTVSTGSGDSGGVSYGSYQMATNTGTVGRFVSQDKFPWRGEFERLIPGTPEFTAKWKEVASTEPVKFQQAQHAFVKKTHYDPLVTKILVEEGLNINQRSRALQNAVWSTAVQHGGSNSVVHNALATITLSKDHHEFDKALIKAIYAERGRKRSDGNLAWFSKSSRNVQAGVSNRFKNELIDALQMLEQET